MPMTRPRPVGVARMGLALLGLLAAPGGPARAQAPAAPAAEVQPGQFFTVVEPITSDTIKDLRAQILPYIKRVTEQGTSPVIVVEFRPGKAEPGQSPMGASSDLARFLARDLGAAKRTIAFVPEPLSGPAVLAVLGCSEVVMGPQASLGPILPEGRAATESERALVRELAGLKARDPELGLGMLTRAEVMEVHTGDRRVHFIPSDQLAAFQKANPIVGEPRPLWEGARRGALSAARAREVGVAALLAEDRRPIVDAYHLPSAAEGLAGEPDEVVIPIDGVLGAATASYARGRISGAVQRNKNLLIFDLNSDGGSAESADEVADMIARLPRSVRSVAVIDDRAMGVSALVALACDEIVFRRGGKMGEMTKAVSDGGSSENLDERMQGEVRKRARELARLKGHPEAIAEAMADGSVVVKQARDSHTGAVVFVTQKEIDADPTRYTPQGDPVKEAGEPLTVTSETAPSLGMAQRVVGSIDELAAEYGIRGRALRFDRRTWVDELVRVLNTPWMSWLLLFVGLFMLILELKMPGIGLPAIASALAFLLFFWGHFMGGTADRLEILLFLVGLVGIALELFVFPGFGVFGVTGILLVLISVIMASHTFVWPTQEYEYRQMGRTLIQVTATIVTVSAGAIVLGRYFPSLPLFHRMVLTPEPADGPGFDPTQKPAPDPEGALSFLLGEVGRTTTALRPSGKARFGELLVDVTADGFFIEPESPVEVVEVHGARVIVRKA